METFVINNVSYIVELTKNDFLIRIKPNSLDIYELKIDNDNELFKDKTFIKNISVLDKIVKNGFKIGFDIDSKISKDDKLNLYILEFAINTTYVQDSITLIVPKVSQPINNEQVIEYCNTCIDTLRSELGKVRKAKNKKIKMLEKSVNEFKSIIEKQNETIQKYESMIKSHDDKIKSVEHSQISVLCPLQANVNILLENKRIVVHHLTRLPVMISIYKDSVHQIYNTCQNLYLEYDSKTDAYYMDRLKKYKIIDFSMSDLSLMRQIKNLTLNKCDSSIINYITCYETLEEITFINMPSLMDISMLRYCTNLKYMCVTGQCNIANYSPLIQLQDFRRLEIPVNCNHKNILNSPKNFVIRYNS